jgi:hypothetical protein
MNPLRIASLWFTSYLVGCAPLSFDPTDEAGGAAGDSGVGKAGGAGQSAGAGETASGGARQSPAGGWNSTSPGAGGAGASNTFPPGSGGGGAAATSTGGASGAGAVTGGGTGGGAGTAGGASTPPSIPPGFCQERSLDVPWPVISGCLQPPDPESAYDFTRLRCPFPEQLNVPHYGAFVACCPPELPYSCPNGTPHTCYASAGEAEAACAGACVTCVEHSAGGPRQ